MRQVDGIRTDLQGLAHFYMQGVSNVIVWVGFGLTFLVYETYAIATKEKKIPTLSRTIWKLTAWEVRLPGPRPTTIKPLRILLFGLMVWLTIHLSFGECAFGLCR